MNKPPTLQGILSQFVGNYAQEHRISPARYKVIRHLTACRTPALGGQFVHCDTCDFQQHRYHSCRNRHCPKCQQKATRQWCEEQQEKLLPVPYYHLVFTLPHELNPWVQCHDDDDVVYQCLFAAVWHTLKTFAADKNRLNGELGMTAILHTWGQNLSRHVHLHCLVPGGALLTGRQSTDQAAIGQPPIQPEWHPAKSNYLFPVKALSRHFRGKMVSALRQAWKQKELPRLEPADVNQTLNTVMAKEWVVYSKSHLKQPDTIVRYLGRYTRKIAISESRIRTVSEHHVTFDYKDYKMNCETREGALGDKDKQMQLTGSEFLRRFLLHVLPQGFMRIRHYGFLSNRSRKQKLAIIRQCLQAPPCESKTTTETTTKTKQDAEINSATCLCPKCKKGRLQVCYDIPATPLYGR